MRDGRVLAAGRVLAMGIDASRVSVDDDAARRPAADLPAAHRPEVPPVRAEMRLPPE